MSDGLTLDEVARRAGVSPRAIRYYLTTGLLARPPKRGRQLRFRDEDMKRLLAIRELQRNGLSLEAIGRRLDQLPPEEVESLARFAAHAPPMHRLVGQAPASFSGTLGTREAPAQLEAMYMSAQPGEGEAWTRIRVTPQFEIQYRTEGGARLREAVGEIVEFARRRLGEV